MNLIGIITSNALGMTLMVMLLVCARGTIHRDNLAERIFFGLTWATFFLCLLEMLTFIIDGQTFPGAHVLSILINTFLFAVNIVFVFLWAVYMDYRVFGDTARIRRWYPLVAIPCYIMLALIVINLFTPLIFSIGDDNVYVRGPLIVMPYAVTFGYLIYAELLVYTNRNNARRYLFLPSIIFFLPIFVAAIIQMLFYGISITWPAVAISLVSIYINIQCEFSAVDPLSGVYTRQYLDAHLRRIAKKQEPMVGIMFDLDRFKSINDTYGHQMGDSAIRQMGLILRNVCASDDVVSRYGGDEFVALRPAATPEAAQELIAQIQQEVQRFNATTEYPFRLSVSAGLCSFDPTLDSVDEFLSRMDASLYTNKRERAKQLPNRRAGNGTAHPNVE